MAEQPANHPGVDIGFGGLGKQQVAARLEHPIELGECPLLLHQVVEGLVAEQDIDTLIGHLEGCAIAADQLDINALARRFGTAQVEAVGVGVKADQALGGEHLLQITERLALAATGIQQHGCFRQRGAEQAAQVVDCHAQHMMLPGVAAQEPEAEFGFFDVVFAQVLF